MYVLFPFHGKGPEGGSKLMLSVQFLEHVIIVSKTIKTSSIFISVVLDPVPVPVSVSVPVPDSGFDDFHRPKLFICSCISTSSESVLKL